ncbi:killer cell lectin-like receptor subfamily B member 1B allele B [Lissotriton helveticus]
MKVPELMSHLCACLRSHEAQERPGRSRKALSRVTRVHAALGLAAAALLIVTAGLLVYVIVLKGRQSSEQPQTKDAQSNAAADGKDGEVLPPCSDDWIWYRNKCFYFSEAEGTWMEAEDACAALNSTLAMIDTQQELDFMLRYKGKRDHWIGLQRETDQQWRWVDDTEFSNWFVVEDHSECAYLSYQKVKSAECYGNWKWICTKESAYEEKRVKRSLTLKDDTKPLTDCLNEHLYAVICDSSLPKSCLQRAAESLTSCTVLMRLKEVEIGIA